jgi:hypothetical protein
MAIVGTALAFGAAGCDWPWVAGSYEAAPPTETLIQTPAEATEPPAPSEVTEAGVGVHFEGPAPQPATREACVERWNAGNATEALASIPPPGSPTGEALVQIGSGQQQDRCIVWVWNGTEEAPEAANYLIEIAPGRYTWGGGVSFLDGGPDATLDADGRLTLR